MNTGIWLVRALRHHGRQHLCMAGGAALAAAILAGALLTGRALEQSLARLASERLGSIRSAVALEGALAPAALADRLQSAGGGAVAPLLQLPGVVRVPQPDGEPVFIPGVQCLGVDARFFRLATGRPMAFHPGPEDAFLSRRLTADWLARVPATASPSAPLRLCVTSSPPWAQPQLVVTRPSPVPVELPLGAAADDREARLRFRAAGEVADDALGRFDLRVTQRAPRNLFLDHAALARLAGSDGMANLWVSDADPDDLRQALWRAWRPEDGGLTITQQAGFARLTHARLYFPASQAEALQRMDSPPVLANYHLADRFENAAGTRQTPYGFIAALTPAAGAAAGPVLPGMGDDEVVISGWLAERLGIGAGETIRLHWRRLDTAGALVATQRLFTVRGIVPQVRLAGERVAMPDFPGLSDVESCADWDIGLPMDDEALRDADNESYWHAFGATPKLYMTHAAGRACFGSHLGDTMAARFDGTVGGVTSGPVWGVLAQVDPASLGFEIVPLAAAGARAVAQTTDFRQLFVGMSFCMMAAALLLTLLLAQLAFDQRRGEIGLLKACGMPAVRIRRVLLAEAALILVPASLAGGLCGGLLSRGLVWSLNRAWSAAVADTRVWPIFDVASWLLAFGAVGGLALLMLAGLLRRRVREPVVALVRGEAPRGRLWRRLHPGDGVELYAAALLNLGREPARSLLVAALLAVGLFLPIAILAMKHDPAARAGAATGGAGGFRWLAESPAALTDADGAAALRAYCPGATVVGMRVRKGDGAECLSLPRAQVPELLGVPLETLDTLGAFGAVGWRRLSEPLGDGTVPALAGDKTTLQYGLGAKAGTGTGTIYEYPAGQGGRLRVRIVGTLPQRVGVLQGRLLIDERLFAAAFPERSGSRLWLVGTESGTRPAGLLRQGWEIESSAERLRALGAMENSYLDMFLVLGGLGALLGVTGLAILLLRNVEARWAELALLHALGLSRQRLVRYLLAEQMGLLALGLLAGAVPALLLLVPAVVKLSQEVPWGSLALLLLGYVAIGVVATLVAGHRILRRPPALSRLAE